MSMVDKVLPEKTLKEKVNALKAAEKISFSYGLTTVDDAGLGMEIIDIQIRRADYPEVTSQAIFARMISERERIAREFRATGEEEAQKIRASAEKQRVVTVADGARQSQEIRGAGDACLLYTSPSPRDS